MTTNGGYLHGGTQVFGTDVRVLVGEQHNLTSQMTQYGVESGKSIVDHVILLPNAVDVKFAMTNSNGGAQKANNVYMHFAKLRDSRTPMTLDTEHARYKNMVIVGFYPDHHAPFKGAYTATLRLSQAGVIGEDSMIEATGGRPESVLADDGTQKTGCGFTNGGERQPITDPALMKSCSSKLGSY